jgi:hypothetical protein
LEVGVVVLDVEMYWATSPKQAMNSSLYGSTPAFNTAESFHGPGVEGS